MKYLLSTLLLLTLACSSQKTEQNNTWAQGDLATSAQIQIKKNDSILNDLTLKIKEQVYPNIHSVLIAKNGKLIYEKYFAGQDQNFGKEIGIRQFTDTSLHDIRSVTKSVVSLLVGIAIDKGHVQSAQQSISDFFPEFSLKNGKEKWTIKHFLTMTTGLEWNENVPYDNPTNDEVQMTFSKYPIEYVLTKPLIKEPGSEFNYSGGATQVLAEIIERASGKSLLEFASENLFAPLEIVQFEWNKNSIHNGADVFTAPSGLRMLPRDLLKIGLLFRSKGEWDGKQIISEAWLESSFKIQINFKNTQLKSDGYGYQFWIWADKIEDRLAHFVHANGNGDQSIYWDAENDIIVVTTAGNYNAWNKKGSKAMLKNHIYPALQSGKEPMNN